MKTSLIATINGQHWLIPRATTTDAGTLLKLFGEAIQVTSEHERESGQYRKVWKPYDFGHGIIKADPEIAMVKAADIRLPAPAKDDTTRSNRAKPVQALTSTPILRLEGGGS